MRGLLRSLSGVLSGTVFDGYSLPVRRSAVSGQKKAGRLGLLTYEEVLRGMNLEEPIVLYRHASNEPEYIFHVL